MFVMSSVENLMTHGDSWCFPHLERTLCRSRGGRSSVKEPPCYICSRPEWTNQLSVGFTHLQLYLYSFCSLFLLHHSGCHGDHSNHLTKKVHKGETWFHITKRLLKNKLETSMRNMGFFYLQCTSIISGLFWWFTVTGQLIASDLTEQNTPIRGKLFSL